MYPYTLAAFPVWTSNRSLSSSTVSSSRDHGQIAHGNECEVLALGNNCEHFCTWARYGFQQSDQVGFGLTAAVAGLGLLLGGPPGAMMGGMLGDRLTKEVRSVRRQQSIKHEGLDPVGGTTLVPFQAQLESWVVPETTGTYPNWYRA